MRLHILNEILEYENSEKNISNIFDEIEKNISKSQYTISHLEVDGHVVYEDFHDYFLDNIRNIKEVKVITKTFKEFVEDIFDTTYDYLKNAISEIKLLSDEFYKSPNKESWGKIIHLIEGTNWIMDSFVIVDGSHELKNIVNSYETWNLYAKNVYSLRKILGELEKILENRDLVSIADILLYELTPLFKEMLHELNLLIE